MFQNLPERKRGTVMRAFLLLSALVTLADATAAWAETVTFNFRGKKFDEQLFRYNGPTPEQYISFEEEGLRIRYPAGNLPKSPVGIVWNCRLRGDFVVIAQYEILQAEPTPGGNGVEVYLMLDNDTKDGIPVWRTAHTKDGPMFMTMHMTTDSKGKRYTRVKDKAPTTPASLRGRICVARQGGDIIASFAEGDEKTFTSPLTIKDIGTTDVCFVRFAGMSSGDPKAQLDVRLLEFQLQGNLLDLPVKAVAAQPPGAPEALPALTSTGSGRWVLWLVIVLGVLSLTVFGVVAVLVRLNRAKAKAQVEPAPEAEKPAAPAIRVSCTGCGKPLKVAAAAAGKRIKCPSCGQTLAVPAAD
jgi:ribosomal protein S27E